MKKICLIILFTIAVAGAYAQQGTVYIRAELARTEGLDGVRIEVTEQPDAAAVVSGVESLPRRTKITVYGVSLFSDNSQTARNNAEAVRAEFSGMFPEIAVELEYESPYFRVTAGKFFDRTDAVALFGKVLPTFKKAVVVQQDMMINEDSTDNR